jgi:hypothetical protein
MAFSAGFLLVLALVCLLLAAWWLADRASDRTHTLIVMGTTPVFAGTGGDSGCNATPFSTIDAGNRFQVQRIRFLKDCATVDVVLKTGQKGYFMLGEGNIVLDPPLDDRIH